MRYRLCLFLFLLPVYGQDQIAFDGKGNSVILHEDGTWTQIELATTGNRQKVILNPDGTWLPLEAALSLLEEDRTIAQVGQVGVEPPIFTKRVDPEYPERAKKIKLQGYVVLEAILRKNGTVDEIKVLRGLGKGKFGFEEEASRCLRKWEFLPGKVNGSPTDVRMTLKVDFVLHAEDTKPPIRKVLKPQGEN